MQKRRPLLIPITELFEGLLYFPAFILACEQRKPELLIVSVDIKLMVFSMKILLVHTDMAGGLPKLPFSNIYVCM